MTIVSTTPDSDTLTVTIINDLAAPPARVWQLWADPRQLERWWAPPGYPMRFEKFDFVPGGGAQYFMTVPDGSEPSDWWTFVTLDEPRSIYFADGFPDEHGEPQGDGMRMLVELTEIATGTRMTLTTTFVDEAQMKEMVEMGMLEGMVIAQGQIEAVLAAEPAR